MKDTSNKLNNNRVFDRVLKRDSVGIATTETLFTLDNGYYSNQDETIVIKSSNETGKFFRKIHGESGQPE